MAFVFSRSSSASLLTVYTSSHPPFTPSEHRTFSRTIAEVRNNLNIFVLLCRLLKVSKSQGNVQNVLFICFHCDVISLLPNAIYICWVVPPSEQIQNSLICFSCALIYFLCFSERERERENSNAAGYGFRSEVDRSVFLYRYRGERCMFLLGLQIA